MNVNFLKSLFLLFICGTLSVSAQSINPYVNVFLGSSGDHGQLTPGASSPLHQLNIVPHTYPQLHAGYEYLAKKVIGFTHNRFEGVGCKGSGGLIMVNPYLGNSYKQQYLNKIKEHAGPGFYEIDFNEGIKAKFAVHENTGIHEYTFPKGDKGLQLDFGYSLNAAWVSNENQLIDNQYIIGKIRAKTTCNVGVYSIYYAIKVEQGKLQKIDDKIIKVILDQGSDKVNLRISFSAVNEQYALNDLKKNISLNYTNLKDKSSKNWNQFLSAIEIKGKDEERKKLFYSLLYRTVQSPFNISEQDGTFRGTDGKQYQASGKRYHGWAIWDNFKTQLPLLELLYPATYQDISSSIASLYQYGKYDFAGPDEPANSVRTEHAAIVLLDAKKKGYHIDIQKIKDQLIKDTSTFDFSKPDKFLEATYDMWAMSQLLPSDQAHYQKRALAYKNHWIKEFKDLNRSDVDRMSARNMYQGTIRQYRWNVPFDVQGLVEIAGGKSEFSKQLDDFFDNHYFNRANEPDIQSPTLYYASDKPWKYQSLIHELALDTVVQYYFNDNSRGIDPFINRIYKNEPKAFIRTMDDDAGAMSAWFVLSAIGLHQPLIGEPVYYLNVPFFPEITINRGNSKIQIKVHNFNDKNRFIKSVKLNGKDIQRLWIKHEELAKNAILEIEATDQPTSYGMDNIFISSMNK